jgi:hypothetical protein
VVGFSGSLAKHSAKHGSKKDTDSDAIDKLKRRKQYSISLVDMRKQEFEADAAKLRALEAQLEELNRKKMLQAQRTAIRVQRKLEYDASMVLGKYIRRWLTRRRDIAAEIVKDFLEMLQKQQAVRAAAWAAAILARFAKHASFRWKHYMAKTYRATQIACAMWVDTKREVLPRVELKSYVPGLVRLHLAHGYQRAVAHLQKRRFEEAAAKKKGGRFNRRVTKRTPKLAAVASSVESMSSLGSAPSPNSSIDTARNIQAPTTAPTPTTCVAAPASEPFDFAAAMASPMMSMDGGGGGFPVAVPEPQYKNEQEYFEAQRVAEVEALHQERAEEAERERQRRLRAIEAKKREKRIEQDKEAEAAAAVLLHKEEAKRQFFARLEASHMLVKKRNAARLEQKLKNDAVLAAAIEKEQAEQFLMMREDFVCRAWREEKEGITFPSSHMHLKNQKPAEGLPKWSSGAALVQRRPRTVQPKPELTKEQEEAAAKKAEEKEKGLQRRLLARVTNERAAAEKAAESEKQRLLARKKVLEHAQKQLARAKKQTVKPQELGVWGGRGASKKDKDKAGGLDEGMDSDAAPPPPKHKKKFYSKLRELKKMPPTFIQHNLAPDMLEAYGIKPPPNMSPNAVKTFVAELEACVGKPEKDKDKEISIPGNAAGQSQSQNRSHPGNKADGVKQRKKKKSKMGKVESLLDMVSKARGKLSQSQSESGIGATKSSGAADKSGKENLIRQKSQATLSSLEQSMFGGSIKKHPKMPPPLKPVGAAAVPGKKAAHRYASADDDENEMSGEFLFDVFDGDGLQPMAGSTEKFGLDGTSPSPSHQYIKRERFGVSVDSDEYTTSTPVGVHLEPSNLMKSMGSIPDLDPRDPARGSSWGTVSSSPTPTPDPPSPDGLDGDLGFGSDYDEEEDDDEDGSLESSADSADSAWIAAVAREMQEEAGVGRSASRPPSMPTLHLPATDELDKMDNDELALQMASIDEELQRNEQEELRLSLECEEMLNKLSMKMPVGGFGALAGSMSMPMPMSIGGADSSPTTHNDYTGAEDDDDHDDDDNADHDDVDYDEELDGGHSIDSADDHDGNRNESRATHGIWSDSSDLLNGTGELSAMDARNILGSADISYNEGGDDNHDHDDYHDYEEEGAGADDAICVEKKDGGEEVGGTAAATEASMSAFSLALNDALAADADLDALQDGSDAAAFEARLNEECERLRLKLAASLPIPGMSSVLDERDAGADENVVN